MNSMNIGDNDHNQNTNTNKSQTNKNKFLYGIIGKNACCCFRKKGKMEKDKEELIHMMQEFERKYNINV